MYFDLTSVAATATNRVDSGLLPDWTILIPFFNERDYLGETIASIAAQTITARVILVDNGSTDRSADIARLACHEHGLDYDLITERVPGKIAALGAGLERVRTRYVATCDADTVYPAHYLAAAQDILDRPGCAVAGAYFMAPGASETERQVKARGFLTAARIFSRQCHAGGAGQAFHTATLRAAGGFDAKLWSFVLEDHEIIHRVMAHGTMHYSADMWCTPSPRERDRESIRWTLFERLLYSAAAPVAGDWFFYTFLARRLRQRRLGSISMRERQYQAPEPTLEGPIFATSHSMF